MTPEVILRELGQIEIGDIELETTDGQKLVLQPGGSSDVHEQKRILEELGLQIPERLSPDSIFVVKTPGPQVWEIPGENWIPDHPGCST